MVLPSLTSPAAHDAGPEELECHRERAVPGPWYSRSGRDGAGASASILPIPGNYQRLREALQFLSLYPPNRLARTAVRIPKTSFTQPTNHA